MAKKIKPEVLAVLGSMVFGGKVAYLPQEPRLERGLYEEVDKVLKALGGKWNRKAKGHVFESDAQEAVEPSVLTGEFTNAKQEFGFFETPVEVADKLVRLADIRPGHNVLEPSAGRGRIALAICRHAQSFRPPINLRLIEKLPRNRMMLNGLGFQHNLLEEADFLEHRIKSPEEGYDRIVMNPPFAKQADHDHVLWAYSSLRPGSRVVSVMSASVKFRMTRASAKLRELATEIQDLPERTFHDEGTDVNTCIVILDRR